MADRRENKTCPVPVWLQSLVDAVAASMSAHNPMGPLTFCYGEDQGAWEVIVYPAPIELLGGAYDGEIVSPGFSLDLENLRAVFERVNPANWTAQSFGPHDSEGPSISIEGTYQGHEVWLRVLAYAPDDEEPGMKLNTK